MKTLVTFVLACGMVWSAFGQLDVPDTLLTVGTTTVDASGRPWVYAVWTPSQPELLAGKRLGVAMKAGAEGGPGLFAPTLPVSPGTEVPVLQVLLQRASQLGENLSILNDAVSQLYRRSNGAGDPSLAEKLSALLQQATVDAPLDQNLRFLAQGHPSLRMALGLGWAGPTPVALGEVFTLELRELDAAGEVVRVLGRLTLTAGQPDPLPAPGAPVQVPDPQG